MVAHVLDLGPLLDPAHTKRAAAIVEHNFRDSFQGFRQAARASVAAKNRGLLICTWLRGGRPAVPTQYSDEVWTGIEYAVAALLLYEGEVEPALRVGAATCARYDGRKQNSWNDIECGDHYVRAMASWTLFEAAAGYRHDAARAEIGFAPVLAPERFRAPFVARDGWGTFDQRLAGGTQAATLTIAAGSLTLARLRLGCGDPAPTAVAATVDGANQTATLRTAEPEATIASPEPLTLRAGQTLTVALS